MDLGKKITLSRLLRVRKPKHPYQSFRFREIKKYQITIKRKNPFRKEAKKLSTIN
jgi:hypothetical protein